MIEIKTIDLAKSQVQRLSDVEAINFYAGTPVSEIASTLSVDVMVENGELVDSEVILEYINDDEDHTANLTQAKELCVRSIRQLSDIIRNTINPHIRRVTQLTNDCVYESADTIGFTIKPFKLSQLILNPLVSSIVERWKNGTPQSTNMGKGIGELDTDYIVSCLKFSDQDEFNSLTNEYVSDNTQLGLIRLLLDGKTEVVNIKEPEVLALTLLVLIATKTPPPNTSSNLAEWELNRQNLLISCSRVINSITERYNRAVNNGVLYTKSFDPTSKVILVNESVYKGMLDKGLTPEAVIGNELLERKFLSHLLTEESAVKACEAKYRQEQKANEAALKLNIKANLSRNLRRAVLEDLDQIASKEAWPVDGDNKEKAGTRLKTVIDKLFSNEFVVDQPIEDIVAATLLATWYAHTDAGRLMDIASRLCKEDPDLNAEEAFTLAKIEYVGLYIASQLHLSGSKVNQD